MGVSDISREHLSACESIHPRILTSARRLRPRSSGRSCAPPAPRPPSCPRLRSARWASGSSSTRWVSGLSSTRGSGASWASRRRCRQAPRVSRRHRPMTPAAARCRPPRRALLRRHPHHHPAHRATRPRPAPPPPRRPPAHPAAGTAVPFRKHQPPSALLLPQTQPAERSGAHRLRPPPSLMHARQGNTQELWHLPAPRSARQRL